MVAVVFLEIFGEEDPLLVGAGAFAAADGWAATAAGFGWAGASVFATERAVGSPGQNDGRGGAGTSCGFRR